MGVKRPPGGHQAQAIKGRSHTSNACWEKSRKGGESANGGSNTVLRRLHKPRYRNTKVPAVVDEDVPQKVWSQSVGCAPGKLRAWFAGRRRVVDAVEVSP